MTFATATLNNSSDQIAAIEAQIVSLQQQLTELQENQQKIKSAEQQGLSAIAQYKAAINAIAALAEPDMLKEFLREMATITAESVDCPSIEAMTDSVTAETEVEPSPTESSGETIDVDASGRRCFRPLLPPETDNLEAEPEPETEPEQVPLNDGDDFPDIQNASRIQWATKMASIRWQDIKKYAAAHKVKGKKRQEIIDEMWNSGILPEDIQSWIA
jgi:uncharacterized phage infection (PIP) family protein YhgE